ncbi:uncharacterized protein LOC117333712 [Pecten maximus]|uniref:uncharacterized protein LOC117333712 n=1 Tax=Pecten maximus TaxID=6579 RepID=UPI0014588521|nr:uncharacterized protein LOC117333712 [Pecten maximus]
MVEYENISMSWLAGDLVIGSSTPVCTTGSVLPNSDVSGIFAKVETIERFQRQVELHVTRAEALELIEEAEIHVSVNTDVRPAIRTREKRHMSNVLKTVLSDIDWNNTMDTMIPFNKDNNTIHLTKLSSNPQPILNVSGGDEDLSLTDETDFLFTCSNCGGKTKLKYRLRVKIDKVNNNPVIKVFTTEVEGEFSGQYNFHASGKTNMTLSYDGPLWDTEPTIYLKVPIATFSRLPAVEVIVKANTEAFLAVNMTTLKPFQIAHNLTTEGTFLYTDEVKDGESTGAMSFPDWTTLGTTSVLETNEMFSFHAIITHKIHLKPYIGWSLRDITMDFGAPYEIQLSQHLETDSNVEDTTYCTSSVSEITGSWKHTANRLDVVAFDINIWNVLLENEQKANTSICKAEIARTCRANCKDPVINKFSGLTMESVCGDPEVPIYRHSSNFDSLKELFGNLITFPDSDSHADWCGQPGVSCTRCDEKGSSICANRLLSAQMAATTTRLAKFVKSEWPDRSLILKEGWSEPTSRYPNGKYGDSSLYYEGRAAKVGVSTQTNSSDQSFMIDERSDVVYRLLELTSCAGFTFYEMTSDTDKSIISTCLKKPAARKRRKRREASREELDDAEKQQFLDKLTNLVLKSTPTPPSHFNTNSAYPKDVTAIDILSPVDEPFSVDNNAQMKRMMQYPPLDVTFEPEGPADSSCGTTTRRCKDCATYDEVEDPWDWCLTRTMTPRMALRLRRLSILSKIQLAVIVPHERDDADVVIYRNVGRALRLKSTIPTVSQTYLANLAISAGFDYICLSGTSGVDVFVRDQAGYMATLEVYPRVSMLHVNPATPELNDYTPIYVKAVSAETIPGIIDGINEKLHLSDNYMVSDFKPLGKRYFRMDVRLLECIEEVTSDLNGKLHILASYKTYSMNDENIEERHEEEKIFYTRGQALQISGYEVNDVTYFDLAAIASSLIKRCVPALSLKQMALGIGCHAKFVYVDVREKKADVSVNFWNVDNEQLYKVVKDLVEIHEKGGVLVQSKNTGTKCAEHPLGKDAFYIKYGDSDCNPAGYYANFCADTKSLRKDLSSSLASHLWSGAQGLSKPELNRQTNDCLVNNCGGCIGKGDVWNRKLRACHGLLKMIVDATASPFPNMKDNAAFFNTENHDSKIHSLACHDHSVCVENLPLFSNFITTVNEKYRPFDDKNIEEMLFGPGDNPSPVLDMLEQEMAYRVKGHIRVYIETIDDLSALEQVLKILMVYNKNVTDVSIEITDETLRDFTSSRVQKKLDKWSSSVCPYLSRQVIAPYTISLIPEVRTRRSIELSKNRNKRKAQMRNWELEWASNISL